VPNTFLLHPTTQELSFGYIDGRQTKKWVISEGDIRLRKGKHTGPNKGFGAAHIWAEHRLEMERAGFLNLEDVPAYVAGIICTGAPYFCEFESMRGKPRLTVIRTTRGKAILELKGERGGPDFYSVVTAYSDTKTHGTRVGTVR